jgi:hypothetical protein
LAHIISELSSSDRADRSEAYAQGIDTTDVPLNRASLKKSTLPAKHFLAT